ncbi:FMN-dependent NADH-azoreductase [Thalassospira mesophila]|uniref:FMN dependent NADH:quinone oxidoreductase n=1 Tax=Thalassospira mesophila TaxID=1293891 RepID=A0A1Y2KX11_9PROT|nr:NAD(P)H-dependent oxidoreductase [Thalassospira mesophila]OSQ36615.1 FMN-dependent NADH-azoreductase [Thalassospira mesophila]
MSTILHIDPSVNGENSKSRQLALKLIDRIKAADPSASVTSRALNANVAPALSGDVVGAYYTPADSRSDAQKALLANSDTLVGELQAADTVVIGVPMYNFAVPSTLKAWNDMVARVGVTFNYTENGPVGALTGKKAYLVVATGGVPVNSAYDFATPYMKQFLAFLGISDVTVVEASGFAVDAEKAMATAIANVEAAALPVAA